MARHAIRAIGRIGLRFRCAAAAAPARVCARARARMLIVPAGGRRACSGGSDRAVESLLEIVELDVDYVRAETVVVMQGARVWGNVM